MHYGSLHPLVVLTQRHTFPLTSSRSADELWRLLIASRLSDVIDTQTLEWRGKQTPSSFGAIDTIAAVERRYVWSRQRQISDGSAADVPTDSSLLEEALVTRGVLGLVTPWIVCPL